MDYLFIYDNVLSAHASDSLKLDLQTVFELPEVLGTGPLLRQHVLLISEPSLQTQVKINHILQNSFLALFSLKNKAKSKFPEYTTCKSPSTPL